MKQFDEAIKFAVDAHSGMQRRRESTPYILHPLEAATIAGTMTSDAQVLAAAVLHDTLEDTTTTKEELERNFGKRVADLVKAESENKREGQPEDKTWRIRKEETIKHLRNASTEIRMIALGDKLSNIRAMTRDYAEIGEELWKKFNNPNPIYQGMYYGLLANVFGKDDFIRNTPEYKEYITLCAGLFSDERDGDGNLIG